jgi:hypothetical protein
VEAAGIEPSDDFDASEISICDCENCQQCRAANALHEQCFKMRFLTTLDADLQRVIGAWGQLSDAMRIAMRAFVESIEK